MSTVLYRFVLIISSAGYLVNYFYGGSKYLLVKFMAVYIRIEGQHPAKDLVTNTICSQR